jgi:hypothetical protein
MVAKRREVGPRGLWCHWAVPSLLLLTLCGAVAFQQPSAAPLHTDVLAQLEKELKRLDEQAEGEPGPEEPTPSRVISYYLLAGVAGPGKEVKGLTKTELAAFGIKPGTWKGKVVELDKGSRLALWEAAMCVKTESIVIHCAAYFVHRKGKWEKVGYGWVVAE